MQRIMSKEEFLSVYERQQASGLTIKDFCENELTFGLIHKLCGHVLSE